MKVVLDTNVLMSGIFFAGIPGRILAAWWDDRFEMIASVEVLAEYREVAERLDRRFPAIDAASVVDAVCRHAHLVVGLPIPASACTDPDDLEFLACAVAAKAACIVSGDRALLRATGFGGVEVLTPRQFEVRYL